MSVWGPLDNLLRENAALRLDLALSRSVYQSALEASELQIARLLELDADIAASREREQRLRAAAARTVYEFTGGIYCTNCGESIDDGCAPHCVIGPLRTAIAAAAPAAVAREPRGEGV